MKKTVSIQEAIKANEHSRVRIVGDDVWIGVGQIKEMKYLTTIAILADWEIEAKPLELWVNVYPAGYYLASGLYKSKEEADLNSAPDRIRCVKMREVVENEN